MMRLLLGNPYAIGGLALVFACLAGFAGVNYYRAKAATVALASAQADAERASEQVSQLTQRLYNVNTSLTKNREALDNLRSQYERRASALRAVPDPTGCTDSAVPADIGGLFVDPGPD